MNERIKALMGKTLDSEFSQTWDTMTYEGLLQFSEKFAELILRDCLEIMDDEDDYAIERSVRMAAYRIKERFGVEK
jgi:small nuclear ribonucleoprotein (snRNP)-like protein